MKNQLTFRKALSADIEALNSLMRASKAYWGYQEDCLDKFMQTYQLTEDSLTRNVVILLEEEGCIVGFYSLVARNNHQIEIILFFIHSSYLGKGLGKALWLSCLETAKSLTAKEITVKSVDAESFYQKMGFQRVGLKESSLSPGQQVPIMHLSLVN